MLRKTLIVIAMLSLFMTAAALAQPAQKRPQPRKTGIWGMETGFSETINKSRPKQPRATSGIIGGLGGAALGIQKPRAWQAR